jgi:enoyl-CoA hydratase/carnithine racemase
MNFIKTKMQGRVGTIAFDHYCKRNALSKPLINECLDALANFERDGVRAVVLRSIEAQKVWSAGRAPSIMTAGVRS